MAELSAEQRTLHVLLGCRGCENAVVEDRPHGFCKLCGQPHCIDHPKAPEPPAVTCLCCHEGEVILYPDG